MFTGGTARPPDLAISGESRSAIHSSTHSTEKKRSIIGSGPCCQRKPLLAFRYRSTFVACDWWEDGPADRKLPEHSGNQPPNGMKYTTSISTRLLSTAPWHCRDMVVAYARPDLTCHGFIINPTPWTFQLICGLPSCCHSPFRCFVTLWLLNLPSQSLLCYLG
jgi:hypothetical protein